MKSEIRLTKPEQFSAVYEKGITRVDRYIVLKARPNQLEYSRFGISVSKKVGNAVTRNRVKRILREILRLTAKKPGWDIVLIARSASANSDYHILENTVCTLLERANIINSKL